MIRTQGFFGTHGNENVPVSENLDSHGIDSELNFIVHDDERDFKEEIAYKNSDEEL